MDAGSRNSIPTDAPLWSSDEQLLNNTKGRPEIYSRIVVETRGKLSIIRIWCYNLVASCSVRDIVLKDRRAFVCLLADADAAAAVGTKEIIIILLCWARRNTAGKRCTAVVHYCCYTTLSRISQLLLGWTLRSAKFSMMVARLRCNDRSCTLYIIILSRPNRNWPRLTRSGVHTYI